MSKELKCPMCQSTDIETYKDNPDDKGMCWHTYYECRKCGRTCRDYDWLKLTDYEKETIKTKMLTAEVERLKSELEIQKNLTRQSCFCAEEAYKETEKWKKMFYDLFDKQAKCSTQINAPDTIVGIKESAGKDE